MASERTENDQETLSQRTIVRIAVGLLGLLTCTLIVFALKQTSRAGGLAERNQSNAGKVRQVVSSASVISAEDKTSGNNAADGAGIKTAADSLGCCRQKDFGSQKLVLNRVRLPHHRRTSYLPPQEQPSRTH